MAKTLKDFLNERQLGPMVVKNPDEQKFIDKHVVAKTADRNGNDDELFKGSKVKMADRPKHRKGYNPGEDEEVYEALKGDQHKIDANKNGKVDAHDFHLLRKKKKVAEEAEEPRKRFTIIPNGNNGYAVHDSKERKLHAGPFRTRDEADRALKLTKEEVEQIDELDHKLGGTLSRYINKTKDNPKREEGRNLALKKRWGDAKYGTPEPKVKAAVREEAEELEELSKATLGSYVKKAKDQMSRSDQIAGIELGQRHMGARPGNKERKHNQRASKRYFGIDKAVDKLTKEEVELEEKLDMKKASMGTVVKDFQKSDAPQFQGKSQKKRQVMAIAAKLSAERGGKPLNKEERLLAKLADISETHKRTMVSVFEKLNEDNQREFMLACDTAEGIEQMLDFSISHRGE